MATPLLNNFAMSNGNFKQPGLGVQAKSPYNTAPSPQTTLPSNQIKTAPVNTGLSGNATFKQATPSNLGINGQPQTGNISFGDTYRGIVGSGLNFAANIVAPGSGLLYQALTRNRNQSGSGQAAPTANAATSGNQPTSFGANNASGGATIGGPGNGGQAWTPKTDQYGNPLGGATNNIGAGNTGGATNPSLPFDPNSTGLYGQLIASLANRANQPSQQYTDAYNQAQTANQQLQESRKNEADALAANASNPIPLEFQQGRARVMQDQYLQQQNALASQFQGATNLISGANTQQGLQQSGIQGAANLAAPQQVSYSNQYLNPLTGQSVGGGQGGNLQGAVSNVVQRLQNGTMTYGDAVSALSGYGQGGINALQQALPSNFNIAQSNTLAGQQGSIGPALQYATVALQNLKSSFAGLQVPGQQSNIPLVSSLASGISSSLGIGKEQTTTKEGALAEARQAIQSVLASVRGGTPTDYTAQSHSMLPDNATPADVDAAVATLNTLGTAKQSIYGNSGNASTQTGGTSSGGAFNW